MRPNELSLGDWVQNKFNHQPEQVVELHEKQVMLAYNDLYDYDEIEAIPLTAETLEKCGFSTKDEPGNWTGYRSYGLYGKDKKCLFMLRLYEKDVRCEISLNSCPYYIVFKYLHELQHPLRHLGVEIKPEQSDECKTDSIN